MTVMLHSLPVSGTGYITLRPMKPQDQATVETLLDISFGSDRLQKTAQLLRDGNDSIAPLDLVAIDLKGDVCGSIRYWPIEVDRADGRVETMLWLGPLVVHPDAAGKGIGASLMRASMQTARAMGFGAVLLIGDAPWYQRFGFSAAQTGALTLPGTYDPDRLLMAHLDDDYADDCGDGYAGMIRRPWMPDAVAAQ